ncbi:MAG: hypothetical protein QJR07_12545, partial [Acetobacteraceae bacterium]|nr:hypothetical protein [Acetobacteraceae bacterium]
KEDFRGQPSFTGQMSFVEFWESWPGRNNWQCEPQWKRFRNHEGNFDLDYLIDYDNIDAQFAEVCGLIGVPVGELRPANVSPTEFDVSQVPPDIAEQIRREYAQDLHYQKNFTGRRLRERLAAA